MLDVIHVRVMNLATMTIDQARRVIRDDSASQVDRFIAAGVISSCSESTLNDFLVCLKRGGTIASGAATTLYLRTKRPRKDCSVTAFSIEYEDWYEYLTNNHLL